MDKFETNKIICGDCIEEMKKMPDQCVDLIFADPPYWLRVDGVLHRVNGNQYDGCNDEWDQFSSIDDYKKVVQAKIKELLLPYIVGCIVVFGTFAIWKIVITVASQIA